MASRSPAGYRWRAGALLRTTTAPDALDLPEDLDLFGATAVAQGRAWLAGVWQRAEVRDALSAASPVLCQQVEAVLAGKRSDPRRVRRAVLSVASYLLRWQRRPTPFGLFAGVAQARIGAVPQVSWGQKHRTMVRADAEWLTDVIARLEQCPRLLERLPVVANDSGHARGERYVAPGPPADGRAQSPAPIEVSVRRTRPVVAALDAARTPIKYGKLHALLTARFSTTATHRIDAMLRGLVTQNMLITCLRAPMTCLDALNHVCAELDTADAENIPDVAELVHQLHVIRDEMSRQDPAAPWSARSGLIERMRTLSDIASVPLITDTAVDCDIQIPEQVAEEAQQAVNVLYRLTPYPSGYPQWRDYHARFRARYGAGAVVRVLDLVADNGLGLPAGYLGSAQGRAARHLTARDEKLLDLIQQAMLEGREEIVLTGPVIDDLAAGDDADVIPVPRAEVSVEIHAASLDDMARGSFRLAVTGAPRPGSSMAGRFAHLLSAESQARLADTYRAADPQAVAAQLSFAPRRNRNENIVRTRRLLPQVISLAEHREPDENVIGLADLAVTADARRFSLIQLSTGRCVEPRVLHALEAGIQTPPLARFLAEIATARYAVYQAFDFGAAARLPYLPRVRYKRTVVSPARWLLSAHDLPGRDAAMDVWEARFETWRAKLRVPERVALGGHDQRLPLDLDHRLHRLLLRTRLDAARRLELREAPTPNDLAWLGRAHELLLPVTLQEPTGSGPLPISRPVRAVTDDAGYLPGRSTILHAQIHAHPERYDDILIKYLPDLIEAFGAPLPWWFTRHRELTRPDADQHLALYLCLSEPGTYGQAAERICDWADGLRHRRLISQLTLATYEPQSGRYGHGPAMDAVHEVFAMDSAASLTQIQMATLTGMPPQALAAASMVDLAARFAASAEDGQRWLVRQVPHQHGRLDRTLRDQALDLADPHGPGTTLRSLPGGGDVAAAWQNRAAALRAYRGHLATQRNPDTVLRSLLHLHHVRAISVDPELERITDRLARTCALRHTAHRQET